VRPHVEPAHQGFRAMTMHMPHVREPGPRHVYETDHLHAELG
jgi:hypothetical protein